MSIEIDFHERGPSGTVKKGIINFGHNQVRFEDRTPMHPVADEPFVLETGLGAGIESLVCAGRKISELGYRAISVGHTHHDTKHPIRHNAEDIEATVEALTGDSRVHATGLSRGWPAQVLATSHMPEKVVSLTAVAPAMMAPINPTRITMLGLEVIRETAGNPLHFGRVLVDCARTVIERPDVTLAEATKLLFGHVHERVAELKKLNSGIDLHLVASVRDGFFDHRQLEFIANILQFDTVHTFSSGTAGHGAFAYSPELVASIVHTATTHQK